MVTQHEIYYVVEDIMEDDDDLASFVKTVSTYLLLNFRLTDDLVFKVANIALAQLRDGNSWLGDPGSDHSNSIHDSVVPDGLADVIPQDFWDGFDKDDYAYLATHYARNILDKGSMEMFVDFVPRFVKKKVYRAVQLALVEEAEKYVESF